MNLRGWKIAGLVIAALIIVADQLSKWWLVAQVYAPKAGLPTQDFWPWLWLKAERLGPQLIEVTSYLNLVMVWNQGVSFGMFQSNMGIMTYVLSLVALVVSGGFLVWMWREPSRLRCVSIGMIVGGALGNVWDRLRFGAVIDFVDVHVAGWHWPAFNVADASICVGVALLLVHMLFYSDPSTT